MHSIANSSLYTYEYAINFRYFLEGRQFIAYSEHEPLTFCMSKNICQDHGQTVNSANFRISLNSQLTLDMLTLASFSVRWPKTNKIPKSKLFAQPVQAIKLGRPSGTDGVTLLCDVSAGQARPLVPVSWRHQVFDLMHGLSQPSVRSTRKIVAS